MSVRDELEAEARRLLRGIKAPRGEGNGYNISGKALARRVKDAKRRAAQAPGPKGRKP
jgi:hypothetical protein